MALELVSLTNVDASFIESGVFAAGTQYQRGWQNHATWMQGEFYYDRFDRWYSPIIFSDGIIYCDPLMADSSDASKNGRLTPGAGLFSDHVVGQWDKVNDIQNVYGDKNDGNSRIALIDLITMTTAGWAFNETFGLNQSAAAQTEAGSWNLGSGGMVVFEDWGWALAPSVSWAETGSGGGYEDAVPVLIDLTGSGPFGQGKASLLEGLSTFYTSAATHESHSPEFGGDTFAFTHVQFVPDDDDSMGQPKGRLFFQSNPVLSAAGPPPVYRTYLKIVEFNPFSKAATSGNPSRTHLRELLISRIQVTGKQAAPTGIGVRDDFGGPPWEGATWDDERLWYHPPSNTLRALFSSSSAAVVGDQTLLIARPSAVLATNGLVAPTQVAQVETAKTVTWQTHAEGDLGERIAGVDVAWTLKRTSTLDETLDVSGLTIGAGGACPAVENIPITYRTVYEDGSPLTEGGGSDYTTNPTTGVITLNAPHPHAGAVYTIDYSHPEAPALPSHATLKSAFSVSDELGIATTRIEYPDDDTLEEQREELTVTSV
jgi:hypothetical protein